MLKDSFGCGKWAKKCVMTSLIVVRYLSIEKLRSYLILKACIRPKSSLTWDDLPLAWDVATQELGYFGFSLGGEGGDWKIIIPAQIMCTQFIQAQRMWPLKLVWSSHIKCQSVCLSPFCFFFFAFSFFLFFICPNLPIMLCTNLWSYEGWISWCTLSQLTFFELLYVRSHHTQI